MSEAKTPKAKTPKAKPFGTGKFSEGEGWVHLAEIAISLSRRNAQT